MFIQVDNTVSSQSWKIQGGGTCKQALSCRWALPTNSVGNQRKQTPIAGTGWWTLLPQSQTALSTSHTRTRERSCQRETQPLDAQTEFMGRGGNRFSCATLWLDQYNLLYSTHLLCSWLLAPSPGGLRKERGKRRRNERDKCFGRSYFTLNLSKMVLWPLYTCTLHNSFGGQSFKAFPQLAEDDVKIREFLRVAMEEGAGKASLHPGA